MTAICSSEIGSVCPSRKRTSALSSGPNSIPVITEVTGITPAGSNDAPRRWLRKLLLPALKRPKTAMLSVSARANARQLSSKEIDGPLISSYKRWQRVHAQRQKFDAPSLLVFGPRRQAAHRENLSGVA